MDDAPKVCIVIPCYNEEDRLPVEKIIGALNNDPDLEICCVNDGSTDETLKVIKRIQQDLPDKVQVLDLKKNVGKAEAVRQGMLLCADSTNADYVAYFDADLATPLEEARSMVKRIPKEGKAVMIFGSRVKLLGSTDIERLWYRHYFGRVFATVVSNMLSIPVYDTQCGAKMFDRSVVKDLFTESFVSKWIFDVELFYRCLIKFGRKEASSRMLELSVSQWHEIAGSKIGLGFILKVPFELIRIRRTYHSRIK